MKYLIFIMFCFSFLASCKAKHDYHNHDSKSENVDKSGKEFSSKFICPMHCKGSGSDSLGICPVCGMDYVENKENHDGHHHNVHDQGNGHNH